MRTTKREKMREDVEEEDEGGRRRRRKLRRREKLKIHWRARDTANVVFRFRRPFYVFVCVCLFFL